MNQLEILRPFTEPLESTAQFFIDRIPGFVAAFLLLLFGLLAARGLRALVERVLDKARLDRHTASIGMNELLTRLGLGKSPTYLTGFVVYWFTLMAFVVSAANAVNLPVVTALLERFLLFIPHLIAAILILFGGLLFARFMSEVVSNASVANNIRGGLALSKASYAVVMGFAAIMALEQLGIHTALVSASIQIVLGSIGLAFALAFGLAGRDIAGEMLRAALDKKKAPGA